MNFELNVVASSLLVAIFVNAGQQNLSLDGVELRLERILCYHNLKYIRFRTCNVKFISTKIANMNVIFEFKQTITALIYRSRSYYKFSNNQYRPVLVDLTTEFCSSQAGFSVSPFHKLIQNIWANYTNIFRTCPIPPGVYYIKDWNFSYRDLPSVFPAGRYLWNVTARNEYNDWLFNVSIYFYIANYGTLDLAMG